MRNFEDKVAFVTGGSSGIGQGIVRALVAARMKVAFTYMRDDHLAHTMNYLDGKESRVLPIRLDVTDRNAMSIAAEEVYGHFGIVDLLINNAGINIFNPMDSATYDDWDWIIDVNLKGVINGIVTFLPGMKARKNGGHIVNTASMGAFIAGPNAGMYTTTKFAVRGLTESLRYCLADFGIGVSLLCPGLVQSNIYSSEELRPKHYGNTCISRTITVERLKEIHARGMDPLEVGLKTLEGVRQNAAYIFTHPDHQEELRETFEQLLSAFPDEPANPERMDIENLRRQRITAIQKQLRDMEH